MQTETEKLTRKDKEKIFRRREIIQAARDIFSQRGFTQATLDEIAERAEFGKGTLYNYFPSKDDLFHAVIQDVLDDVIRFAQDCCGNQQADVRSTYLCFARRLLSYLVENHTLHSLVMREMHKTGRQSLVAQRLPELVGILEKPLTQAIEQNRVHPVPAYQTVSLFVTLVFTLHRCSDLGEPCDSPDDQATTLLQTISTDIDTQIALLDRIFFQGLLTNHTHP